jgi:flavin-dependent dehydrogenase
MKSYDVVIVGAGLAGLELSRLLAESRLRVLLIDRKASLTQAVHTTGIFVRRTLEDFALPDDCLGPAVRDVSLYSPGRRKLDLHSPHEEFRVGRMGLLYERCLDNAIRAGIEWMPATQFVECSKVKNRSLLQLRKSGAPVYVATRYLVGADGANSRVARALGLDENQEWIVGLEEVLEDVPLAGPPRFHCFLDPELAPGYLAWAVHDGEQVHVGVGGYPAQFDPVDALKKFRASLGGTFDLSNAKAIERRSGRIPVGGVLRRIANSHGLLLGDAAGAVSPLTAGGLDPCLRLSKYAAGVIVDYLRTENTEALSAYSGDLFRTRFVSRLWMRRVLNNVRSPLVMELGCALMRLPLFRSFAHHVFFGRGSFPDITTKAHTKQQYPAGHVTTIVGRL